MRKLRNHTWVKCPYCNHHYWMNDIWLDEPPERLEHLKKLHCPNSKGHIKILQDERFNSVTIEQRQEILDLMKTSITVGQVAQLLNIDSMVIAEVFTRNIIPCHYLRTESI